MATLEFRNGWYRLLFRFRGARFAHSLHTRDRRTAEALRGTVDRTILLIQQRLLAVPDDADIKEFIVSGGVQIAAPATAAKAAVGDGDGQTLGKIRDRYVATLGIGAVEENTLDLIRLHFRHWVKSFGERFRLDRLENFKFHPVALFA